MRYLSLSLSLIVLAIGLPLVAQAINPVIDEQHKAMLGLLMPSWDRLLDSTNGDFDGCNSERFTCVMNGAAVRDNETGLVWERSPDATGRTWIQAIRHCASREVGGRHGWHLGMREQVASLIDRNSALCPGAGPCLPDGHPFQNVQSNNWSATTAADAPTVAWNVFLDDGGGVDRIGKTQTRQAWCVRGGQSFDGNTHSTLH